MKKKALNFFFTTLILILILFAVVFLAKLYYQPKHAQYVPQKKIERATIELTLNNILFDNWNETIIEIADQYPGGEIDSNNNKELSSYRVNVMITDNNKIAQLIFLQNEKFMLDRLQRNVNFRKLTFYVSVKEEIEREYERLNGLIQTMSIVQPNEELANKKGRYLFLNPDKTIMVSVDLKRDYRLNRIDLFINPV